MADWKAMLKIAGFANKDKGNQFTEIEKGKSKIRVQQLDTMHVK